MATSKSYKIFGSHLGEKLRYITDPQKTNFGELVSSYCCESDTAEIDFEMTKKFAESYTGNYKNCCKQSKPIQAYHLIQSFPPTEKLTPAQVHQMGIQFADEVLKGKYEYVVATHIDKKHLHNHIIFNSTSFIDYTKYRTEIKKEWLKLSKINDKICIRNGLDICEKKGRGVGRYEYEKRKNETSWKGKIKTIIDEALPIAYSYENFKEILKEQKCIVDDKGKYITFKFKGMERCVRGKTIGYHYEKTALKNRVGKPQIVSNELITYSETISKLIDNILPSVKDFEEFKEVMKDNGCYVNDYGKHITFKLDEMERAKRGYSIGNRYTKSAIESRIGQRPLSDEIQTEIDRLQRAANNFKRHKVTHYELQAMADAISTISSEKVIDYEDFEAKINTLKDKNSDIGQQIKSASAKMHDYSDVAKCLTVIKANEETYFTWQGMTEGKEKNKFLNENKLEIHQYEVAEKKFDSKKLANTIDTDKMKSFINKHKDSINNLNDRQQEIEKRILKLEKAKQQMEGIISRKQMVEERENIVNKKSRNDRIER